MNYIIPYIGGNVDYKIIPVYGTYAGVYLLREVLDSTPITISPSQLFSGDSKLNSGEVVQIDGVKYEIWQRRVQKANNWTFANGSLVFYGIQHDHMMAMDYQHESGYKDHQFTNVEGWFANLQFNPCFGVLVNQGQGSSANTLIFFETENQIRNPNLDYTNAQSVSSIDSIIHSLLFCVENQPITISSDSIYTTVTFQLNMWFENQKITVQPLINIPLANEVQVDSQGQAQLTYRTSDLYGSIIKFRVFASPISAGTVEVDLSTNLTTLTL